MEKLQYESQIENLLEQDADQIINQHKNKLEQVFTGHRPLVLFGAGRLGRTVLAGLRKAGIEPIAFADNNSLLWGTKIEGIDVLSLADARRRSDASMFVVSVYTASPVRQQLRSEGLPEISFPELAWLFPDSFLPHGALEHPHKLSEQADQVKQALTLWVDEDSRQEYIGQIRWRMSLDDSLLPPHLPQQEIYFSDVFTPSSDETFVDCGSFDGDTVREFIKRYPDFRSIVAVEPDQINYQNLQRYIASLPLELGERVRAVNYAVGSTRGVVQFNETGSAASAVGSGAISVDCLPLDEILKDSQPTFIKMDIEGAETDALLGARRVIENHAPILTICLYHRQEHLWEIPLLLQSFNDQYRFLLRRYADQCWESVCYAIPVDRLKSK
jgi:FkbM family methyltransferase